MGHGTPTLVAVLGHDVNIYYTEIVFVVCVLFTRSRINERPPTIKDNSHGDVKLLPVFWTTSDINFGGGRVRASGKRRGLLRTAGPWVTPYICIRDDESVRAVHRSCIRDDWQHLCRTVVRKSRPFRLWPHAGPVGRRTLVYKSRL